MTTPATKTEPIYIEVPAQRAFKILFVTAYASAVVLALLVTDWFKQMPPVFEFGVGVPIAVMMILAFDLERRVAKRLRSEFSERTGLSLPNSFDPQSLPRKSARSRVAPIDQSGTPVEWTAARNGTLFLFAPA